MARLLDSRWGLVFRTLPFVVLATSAKLAVNALGWEGLALNPLYSSLVAANVFLLGFLLAGTLADYKEGERLPGELATSLESISDECAILHRGTGADAAVECLSQVQQLARSIREWLHERATTDAVLDDIAGLNPHFLAFEQLTQPNFIVRLKQEQNNVRRVVTRIHMIRETAFVGAAYTIAELTSFFLVGGFLFVDIGKPAEEAFLVAIISFVLVYVILLIRDLDDPFDYGRGQGVAEVSLHPLDHLEERIGRCLAELRPQPVAGSEHAPG